MSVSSVFASSGRERVFVLMAQPDLGAALDARRRDAAARASVAGVVRGPAGRWDAAKSAGLARGGLGLLVIEGMLVRRVGLDDRYGAELLAPGDVLQPAEHDGEGATVPFEASWHVLEPLSLAILDLRWMARMAAFPEVTAAIVTRVMMRSRRLATMQAIAHHHRLDDRLHLLFWELADRFGRVGPDGVRLDIDLTHELISHLAGAHRPSVSAALGRLERRGDVRRTGRRWILSGVAPSLKDVETRA